MLVNGVNISVFSGKQMKVDIQPSKIEISKAWLKKSLRPFVLSSEVTFKSIKIQLLFKGDSRDLILKNISNFISKLRDEIELKLDGYKNSYIVTLSNISTVKTISKYYYNVEAEFTGYEVSNLIVETANRVSLKTINVLGNLDTPAIVAITPSIDLIDIDIVGFGDPFTIRNLKQGQMVVVNGEDCTVLQNGVNKFIDFDGWGFPRLSPGANTIKLSKSNCDVTIQYKPRYM